MNYSVTKELLDTIKPMVSEDTININTKNTDWRGKEYYSDFVTIDDKNGVGFEVLENEIIMFYFAEHHHFEDYSYELEDGQPDYIARAKDFLKDLFCCTITQQKVFKGKALISEKYIFTLPDGTTECPAGVWVHGVLIRLVPFLKKRTENKSWRFDKDKTCFIEVTT